MKIGIIGYGRMAKEYHKVLSYLGHEVVCFMRRKNESDILGIPVVTKLSDFLRYEPRMIVVAVDMDQTADVLDNAIHTQLPVLVEKPVCTTFKRFDFLPTEYYPDQVMVGYNRRFYNTVDRVSETLNVKTPLSVFVNTSESLLYSGSHILDLLIYWFNDVSVLKMFRRKEKKSYNGILYTSHYSMPIYLQANENNSSNTEIRIVFDDSVFILKPIEYLRIYSGFRMVEKGSNREYLPILKEEVMEPVLSFKAGFIRQVRAFIDRKESYVASDLGEAKKVLELYERIVGE